MANPATLKFRGAPLAEECLVEFVYQAGGIRVVSTLTRGGFDLSMFRLREAGMAERSIRFP
jgi:hypothetical protein